MIIQYVSVYVSLCIKMHKELQINKKKSEKTILIDKTNKKPLE